MKRQEKSTIQTYNDNAVAWAMGHKYEWPEELPIFQKYLPKGKVLEIGCAGGIVGKLLTDLGHDYVGTDVAPKFVKVAKKSYPGIRFQVEDIYHLTFDDKSFDGFWATAVYIHVPKENFPKALRELKRVLRPHAVGFLTMKEGIGEEVSIVRSQDGNNYKRLWVYYGKDELDRILKMSGFSILQFNRKYQDKDRQWLQYWIGVDN